MSVKEKDLRYIWLKRYGFLLAVLIMVSLYIYAGFLNVFFFHDDFMHLKMVRDFTLIDYFNCGLFGPCTEIPWFWNIGVGHVFRPISHFITWDFYWRLFGTNVVGYHAGNIILHLLNTALIFWITLSLTSKQTSAYIAGLLYTSAFTIVVEPIAILHTVNDSLMSLFTLLAFGLYIQRQTEKVGAWAGVAAVVSYAFALLCNEKAIVFPAILLLYDWLLNPSLPQKFFDKVKAVVKMEVPFWVLAAFLVILRLRNILGGLSGDWFSIQIGWWAFPKYYWGVKWFLSEYIETLQMVKNLYFPALHFNLIFGVILLLLVISVGVFIAAKIRFNPPNVSSFRLAGFGLCWFLLFPLPILFNKPFGAYYFLIAIPGLCLVGGQLGKFILDKFPNATLRITALVLFTLLTAVSANILAQKYLFDPEGNPQRASLSKDVLKTFSDSNKDLSQYDAVYLVGFPQPLFNLGEPGTFGTDFVDYKAAAAFDVFTGYPSDVTQVQSLDSLVNVPCGRALVLDYKDMDTVEEHYIPSGCNKGSASLQDTGASN